MIDTAPSKKDDASTVAGRIYRGIAVVALNTALVLIVFELGASAALVVRSRVLGVSETTPDPRSSSSYYRTVDWAVKYWTEFPQARKQRYHAYTIWRRAPFTGQTINIDAHGRRQTPGAECGVDALRVFTFGGSPMWGTGAPDWGTIAAFLTRDLQNDRRGPVCVQNFGESGYVSTQSVIELALQLQAGNVPNVVIFTDGVNDIYTGYQSGRSGVHENLQQISARFEGTDRGTLQSRLLDSSAFYDVVESQLRRFARIPSPTLLTYETAGVKTAQLGEEIVRTYVGNYEVVRGLAQRFRFQYLFLWPPHILEGRKPLTAEEKALAIAGDPSAKRLYRAVYQSIEAVIPKHPHMFPLTDVFDDRQDLIWIDDTHVTPIGNELIASRIVQLMKSEAQQVGDNPAPGSDNPRPRATLSTSQ